MVAGEISVFRAAIFIVIFPDVAKSGETFIVKLDCD